MSGFDPNRRQALKGMALFGAAALVPTILPIRSARAADLTAGFVYIGPREDWGWNQSFATAAEALRGVPHVRVAQADYLPESTNYGSGKDDPETRAYTKAMEDLIAKDSRPDLFDVVRRRSFPASDGGKIPECRVPPSLGAC
jgi:basic membrane protein A